MGTYSNSPDSYSYSSSSYSSSSSSPGSVSSEAVTISVVVSLLFWGCCCWIFCKRTVCSQDEDTVEAVPTPVVLQCSCQHGHHGHEMHHHHHQGQYYHQYETHQQYYDDEPSYEDARYRRSGEPVRPTAPSHTVVSVPDRTDTEPLPPPSYTDAIRHVGL